MLTENVTVYLAVLLWIIEKDGQEQANCNALGGINDIIFVHISSNFPITSIQDVIT